MSDGSELSVILAAAPVGAHEYLESDLSLAMLPCLRAMTAARHAPPSEEP